MSNHITLKDFLKKYTAISNKFIDEYYSFYEQSENNKFGIPLEKVKLAGKLSNDVSWFVPQYNILRFG